LAVERGRRLDQPEILVHERTGALRTGARIAHGRGEVLIDIRDETRAFRAETRGHFETVFHRLGIVEARLTGVEHRLTSLETHMAALLNVVPVVNQRIDRLEARVAALEADRAG
jgi:hypothetical protein